MALTVTFTNKSEDAVSYEWDFGDGTTSTEESPVQLIRVKESMCLLYTPLLPPVQKAKLLP
jgi:hypothetical protein